MYFDIEKVVISLDEMNILQSEYNNVTIYDITDTFIRLFAQILENTNKKEITGFEITSENFLKLAHNYKEYRFIWNHNDIELTREAMSQDETLNPECIFGKGIYKAELLDQIPFIEVADLITETKMQEIDVKKPYQGIIVLNPCLRDNDFFDSIHKSFYYPNISLNPKSGITRQALFMHFEKVIGAIQGAQRFLVDHLDPGVELVGPNKIFDSSSSIPEVIQYQWYLDKTAEAEENFKQLEKILV